MTQKAIALRFSFVIERLGGVPIPRCAGEFRLLSRRALTKLARLRESHWFLRGLVLWIGFPQTQIRYHRDGRVTGRTHYSRHKMIRLAFDRIASMSLLSMRLASALSLILFGVFIAFIIYVLSYYFYFAGEFVPGWSSPMSAITVFGMVQLLLLEVPGGYIGRIYEQVKQRTPYHMRVKRPRIADEAPRLSLIAAGPGLDIGAFPGRIVL